MANFLVIRGRDTTPTPPPAHPCCQGLPKDPLSRISKKSILRAHYPSCSPVQMFWLRFQTSSFQVPKLNSYFTEMKRSFTVMDDKCQTSAQKPELKRSHTEPQRGKIDKTGSRCGRQSDFQHQ